jgi:formylglycine-generating enzyme required for sulfatase activity
LLRNTSKIIFRLFISDFSFFAKKCYLCKILKTITKDMKKNTLITIMAIATLLSAVFVLLLLNRGNDSPPHDETNEPAIEMVFVQGGVFTMGCTEEQGDDCVEGENPAHQVTVSDFYIGKYVVTQAQWKAVMTNNPARFKGDNLPVESVSLNDVQEFINRLNAQTGKLYRLPTEAEWEFAARGGNSTMGYKYSGSNTVDDVSWYKDNSANATHPVGTKSPNELGIYDMNGNVYEWCNDWYGMYTKSAKTDPTGVSSGSHRVIRGGGWSSTAKYARAASRYISTSESRNSNLGFRLAYGSE